MSNDELAETSGARLCRFGLSVVYVGYGAPSLNRAGLLPHLAATPQDEDGARITLLFSVAPLLASVGNRPQELDQP